MENKEQENKNEKNQSEKKNTSLFGGKFFQKLKGIKHIELIVAVVLGAIILLIYISSLQSNNTTKQTSTQSITSISEYSAFLENKLANVLANIKGAGNVTTMITFESGTEYIYATNEETKTNTNTSSGSTTSTTTSTSSPYVKNNQGLLVKEVLPKISGVVVVASGAKDTKVKLEIIKAVQAVLEVPIANIEVLVGK